MKITKLKKLKMKILYKKKMFEARSESNSCTSQKYALGTYNTSFYLTYGSMISYRHHDKC